MNRNKMMKLKVRIVGGRSELLNLSEGVRIGKRTSRTEFGL